ncbi:PIG-L deacetylase family protein [Streptomyces caeruleatus]|uniref:GlcNAc-PI de-N-acetylase n=1 Tax=Streptomyces caeruleatus TaxID=661399 RepID=A0A101U6E7_9ACTN|nr:PIG-L family deacetylase [Streptomyces caeruleatus]KUO04816.1 GlcNAc-PI de-N-acetylase [Streptomyces caeruleatus]
MAHPDDLELWAGGTLALHARHAPVIGAVKTHDEVRNAEAAASAQALGIELELRDILDATAVDELIRRYRPEVLITHPVDDVHPDHRAVAAAVLAGLPKAHIHTGCPRRLYTCDSYNSLTLSGPVNAPVIIDITTTFDQKMRALAEHRSQPIDDHFGPMAQNLAALWGGRIGASHAEAFTPVPILGRLPGAAHL